MADVVYLEDGWTLLGIVQGLDAGVLLLSSPTIGDLRVGQSSVWYWAREEPNCLHASFQILPAGQALLGRMFARTIKPDPTLQLPGLGVWERRVLCQQRLVLELILDRAIR
ncbi:MAG: hypothetical protein QHH07_03280 [Sedimentisphaerales bacterium]|nr:hypothetical protein [Sedimentisphaerales bacterium]